MYRVSLALPLEKGGVVDFEAASGAAHAFQ